MILTRQIHLCVYTRTTFAVALKASLNRIAAHTYTCHIYTPELHEHVNTDTAEALIHAILPLLYCNLCCLGYCDLARLQLSSLMMICYSDREQAIAMQILELGFVYCHIRIGFKCEFKCTR